MTLCRLMIVLLASLLVAGCEVGAPGAVGREPVILLAGLHSYESPQQTRARLSVDNWTLRHIPGSGTDDSRPKYEKHVAEINWRDCGQDGTMILTFVNERLYITTFVPANLDACLEDLTNRGTLGRNRDQRVKISTGELDGRPFVAATDTRLEAEVDAWISRYS